MPDFVVFRVGRIKSVAQAKASQGHCDRTHTTKNADPERQHLNRQLLGDLNTLIPTLHYVLYEASKKRKIPHNANLLCEAMLSASPAWFRDGDWRNPINPQRVEQFVECAIKFIQTEFGDACLAATLHLDEMTPHIHFHFVPLHRGSEKHPDGGWLSWEDWFGDRQKLQQWQAVVASYMEPIGLVRGVKGSFATHEDIKTFYGEVNASVAEKARLKAAKKAEANRLDEQRRQLEAEKRQFWAEQIATEAAALWLEKKGKDFQTEDGYRVQFDRKTKTLTVASTETKVVLLQKQGMTVIVTEQLQQTHFDHWVHRRMQQLVKQNKQQAAAFDCHTSTNQSGLAIG